MRFAWAFLALMAFTAGHAVAKDHYATAELSNISTEEIAHAVRVFCKESGSEFEIEPFDQGIRPEEIIHTDALRRQGITVMPDNAPLEMICSLNGQGYKAVVKREVSETYCPTISLYRGRDMLVQDLPFGAENCTNRKAITHLSVWDQTSREYDLPANTYLFICTGTPSGRLANASGNVRMGQMLKVNMQCKRYFPDTRWPVK